MRFRFLNMKMKTKNTRGENSGMMNLNKVKFNRKKLYDEIWELSVAGVAKKYNLHYSKLINSLKENNIPYPSSGYWTRLACGKDVTNDVVPLPKAESDEIYLYPVDYSSIKKNADVDDVRKDTDNFIKAENDNETILNSDNKNDIYGNTLSFLDEEERNIVINTLADIHVKLNGRLHPVLVAYKKSIEEWKQKEKENRFIRRSYYDSNRRETIERPAFMSEVSDAGLNRVIAILDAIYKTVEKLGGNIQPDLSMKIRKDVVRITFLEGQDKREHELTKQEAKELLEYKEKIKFKEYALKPQIKKYDYYYNGKMRVKFSNGSYIRDNNQKKLEDRLDDIIIELYCIAEESRVIREKREEEHRKYLEGKKREEEQAVRIEEEKQKTQALVNEAKDYQIACEIRNYISSIKNTENIGEEEMQWIIWAEKKADWFDPIIARQDEYLGKRKHSLSEDKKQLIKEKHSSFYY